MDDCTFKNEIRALVAEKNAIIVAHSYQRDEIQDIADLVGDSLALSRFCAKSSKPIVVFCGVHFMAESAKILSPEKTVLLPDIDAGCPMADMVDVVGLKLMKEKYPLATVVCYINSSAEVKAHSDICCTSSNAINIVRSVKTGQIIFVPDKNLGSYVASKVPEKEIILWDGYCVTHHRVSMNDVERAKNAHAEAVLLVHPECQQEIVNSADFVGSTKEIIDYAFKSEANKFIIGTEMGVLYKLKKDNPNKEFYMLSTGLVCPNMKKTTLQSVYDALQYNKYDIDVEPEIRIKAKVCLERMLLVNN